MKLPRRLGLVCMLCACSTLTQLTQAQTGRTPREPPQPAAQPLRDLNTFQINEKLELDAVASRTLTWLTGTPSQNDYVSVGRYANFFGFVKFRVASGHSLTRSAAGQETYALLDQAQRARLLDLLDEQKPPFATVVLAHAAMNRALEGLLIGEPVTEEEFLRLGERYGAAETELGRVIALGLGEIATTLRADQRTRMAEMRARYLSGGSGAFTLDRRDARGLGEMDRAETQELWNLASRLLTWVTGTPADNDFETVGKPSQHFGFVSLRVESSHAVQRGGVAREVMELLTPGQNAVLREHVAGEASVFRHYLARRGLMLRDLERALAGEAPDPAAIEAFGRELGRLEAQMTWGQAHAILAVRDTMTAEQRESLLQMRAKYTPGAGSERDAVSVDAAPDTATDTETPSLAAAQLAHGRQIFAQCALCHVAPRGGRAVGPPLEGVVNRPIASVTTYEMYSPAMRAFGQSNATWTPELLDTYLERPREVVAGTIMGFDGVRSADDRAALIAYLRARTADDDLVPVPTPPQVAIAPTPAPVPAHTAAPQRAQRPNILLLLSDDQAWSGLSCRMDPDEPGSASALARTPRLAELANQGVRLTRGYAPAPVCSPTRASLQTGKSPGQLHWTKAAPVVSPSEGYPLAPPPTERNLAPSEVTIAELLKAAGYTTAHFGKWHLQGGGPEAHGYDTSDGDTGNDDAVPFVDPNPVDIFGMTERAGAFIEHAAESGTPFFVQMSYHALHHPENAPPALVAEYARLDPRANDKAIGQAALAECLDSGVGMLLDKLDQLGIAENTFVVYMSDNGAGGSGPRTALRGGKGGLWEGGIRVPFIVRGPGLEPGTIEETPVVGYDLFPTFAAIAGVEGPLPAGVEGGNLLPLLQGQSRKVERPADGIVFHFPHYQGQDGPQSAIQLDGMKLVYDYQSDRAMLFDLDADPAEQHDLADERPAQTDRLTELLRARLESIGALLPTPVQADAPAQPRERRRRAPRER